MLLMTRGAAEEEFGETLVEQVGCVAQVKTEEGLFKTLYCWHTLKSHQTNEAYRASYAVTGTREISLSSLYEQYGKERVYMAKLSGELPRAIGYVNGEEYFSDYAIECWERRATDSNVRKITLQQVDGRWYNSHTREEYTPKVPAWRQESDDDEVDEIIKSLCHDMYDNERNAVLLIHDDGDWHGFYLYDGRVAFEEYTFSSGNFKPQIHVHS